MCHDEISVKARSKKKRFPSYCILDTMEMWGLECENIFVFFSIFLYQKWYYILQL